ncbi:MAG TPA: glycoside hydrolase family 38 C-terminal domain-containing protein, partial [Acidimicrobiales bacterium]|nr:glycoside hydrolase family 38 C-terminal domain-containing protein [Acidimicrobiales bacterium]
RLVETLDDVLETLGRDPSWSSFLLDGQVAVLDDYLAVRPAAATRVHRLVSGGRLEVGPWYVLMDEFCVSGETIIRNLQLGVERTSNLGQRRHVGYLPDMFGHTSQMPQLLVLAGIHHAVVWRGVPEAIDRTAFWWHAPDGSGVRAEYLPVGYANGAFLPDDPGALVRRVAALEAEAGHLLPDPKTPLLLMNGTDHQRIQSHVPSTLAAANASDERFRFRITSLFDYLEGAPREGLPCWSGELRSGARAPVLAGTLSNRVDIKSAAAWAEIRLERLAEPLATLWLPPELWPKDQLSAAWLQTIRNSAHDSICACSSDEVTRAVVHRYDTASTIAATIVDDALGIAGVATTVEGPVVVNPSAHPRTAAVEMILPGDDTLEGVQVLHRHPGGSEVRRGTGADLGRIIGELTAGGWLGDAGRANFAEVAPLDDGLGVVLTYDPSRRPEPTTASVLAEAWALAGANRDRPLTVRVERPPTQTVVAMTGPVPGYGWSAWSPTPLPFDPVRADDNGLDNGLLRLTVDPLFGTFSIGDFTGLDRLVDGRDAGDTYTYDPPENDLIVDLPDSTDVRLIEAGPVRGRLRVVRRFTWPSRLHRPTPLPVEVTTELTLVAGERAVRVETRFDNVCRDHRLRALFPLPMLSGTTTAGCAFASVTRDKAEGGAREPALSTYPARGFVSAGGLTVLHEGVREYELVDEGSAVAVTLLRATGILSRAATASRPNIAGPQLPLDGAQMLGPVSARYAVSVGEIDPWQMVEDLWTPMPVVSSTGTGKLPPRGTRLEVRGARVSSLRRVGGRIEIRLFNPSDSVATVDIPGQAGAIVDLSGGDKGRWQHTFELRPWEIKTALLDAVSLDG